MLKTSQHGFTLIELVVVIVILGILAAFAVPRFMGMENEARAATVKSLGGALQSAATLARSKCQAQGCGAGGTITVEGQTITMANGYPNRATVRNALTPASLQGFGAPVNQGGNAVRFTRTGGGNNCWVQYTQATATNPPRITYGGVGANQPDSATFNEATFNQVLANAC